MVSRDRWRKAQEYERGYWEKQATEIARGQADRLTFYEWRAGELRRRLQESGFQRLTRGDSRIVEIGSGPIGVVSYFPGSSRIAVDPLEPFYGTNAELSALRDPGVEYRAGTGEELPVEDGSADLVIMENCIDHTRDVDQVMREIARVLSPGGVLHLTVNCRVPPGYVVHRLLSRFAIDAGHPHTFTAGKTRALITDRPAFRLARFERGSFLDALREDLRGNARARTKALLGVSEFVVSLLAERSAG
jgi:SAM-dependent methyltransferase